MAGSALLHLVGLSKSGWANQFYSAAAQAGSQSWQSFLFGSLDSSWQPASRSCHSVVTTGRTARSTLAAFRRLVTASKVHYYIADGQDFIGSTAAYTSTAYAIQQWATKTCTATTVGGTTVYDLTSRR